MPSITPHLWFDKDAEEAARFYCSVFPNSKIHEIARWGEAGPGEPGSVMTVTFEVEGQEVILLNAGPHFKLDEAFSFFVTCESQDEVDGYWDKLIAGGGAPSRCGWLKDRFGVSWQIIPKLLMELIGDNDTAKANSVMQAMLEMDKIDCKVLQDAYDNG